MKKTIITSAILLSLATAQMASAISISSSATDGALTGAGIYYETLDAAPSTLTVSFLPSGVVLPNAGYTTGFLVNRYAAPYLSGNNDVNFNNTSPVNLSDPTRYITVGIDLATPPSPPSAVLTFTTSQTYFGLLWGSVDTYNTLKFFNGSALVATVTGIDVLNPANGYQGSGGSSYVNITGLTYDSVEFTSSQFAFEFDNVAHGNVPDGGTTMIMLGGVLCGIGAIRRRLSV